MRYLKYPGRWFVHLVSYPFVIIPVIPLVFFDLLGELYHRVCFPLYGIPYIKRSDYVVIDRHKLKYLNWFQKVSCAYCGYVNGFLNYAVAIAGATEQYWCSILHQRTKCNLFGNDCSARRVRRAPQSKIRFCFRREIP